MRRDAILLGGGRGLRRRSRSCSRCSRATSGAGRARCAPATSPPRPAHRARVVVGRRDAAVLAGRGACSASATTSRSATRRALPRAPTRATRASSAARTGPQPAIRAETALAHAIRTDHDRRRASAASNLLGDPRARRRGHPTPAATSRSTAASSSSRTRSSLDPSQRAGEDEPRARSTSSTASRTRSAAASGSSAPPMPARARPPPDTATDARPLPHAGGRAGRARRARPARARRRRRAAERARPGRARAAGAVSARPGGRCRPRRRARAVLGLAAAQPVLGSTAAARCAARRGGARRGRHLAVDGRASSTAASPTRLDRARRIALRVRAALADVPTGLGTFTDRPLPLLLPTPDARGVRGGRPATRSESSDRPGSRPARRSRASTPSRRSRSRGTSRRRSKKRLLVILTDAESTGFNEAGVRKSFEAKPRTAVVLVRIGAHGERVFGAGGAAGERLHPAAGHRRDAEALPRRDPRARLRRARRRRRGRRRPEALGTGPTREPRLDLRPARPRAVARPRRRAPARRRPAPPEPLAAKLVRVSHPSGRCGRPPFWRSCLRVGSGRGRGSHGRAAA